MNRPLRIVSYNILNGGIGRADPIAEVLLAQRPDVVALVEADDPEMLARIAWRLGFESVAADGPSGRTSAVLTRGRIVDSVNFAALGSDEGPRSFLLATVAVDGQELPVGAVHLASKASDERERLREAQVAEVLEATADLRAAGRAHVLCGDFNANSPVQLLERERLPEKSMPHWDANGGSIPRRVVRQVLDAGYTDTLAAARPAEVERLYSFTTLQPGQRLDYIFTFGVEVQDAWIEQDRLATYASDHYPVGAELALSA